MGRRSRRELVVLVVQEEVEEVHGAEEVLQEVDLQEEVLQEGGVVLEVLREGEAVLEVLDVVHQEEEASLVVAGADRDRARLRIDGTEFRRIGQTVSHAQVGKSMSRILRYGTAYDVLVPTKRYIPVTFVDDDGCSDQIRYECTRVHAYIMMQLNSLYSASSLGYFVVVSILNGSCPAFALIHI